MITEGHTDAPLWSYLIYWIFIGSSSPVFETVMTVSFTNPAFSRVLSTSRIFLSPTHPSSMGWKRRNRETQGMPPGVSYSIGSPFFEQYLACFSKGNFLTRECTNLPTTAYKANTIPMELPCPFKPGFD